MADILKKQTENSSRGPRQRSLSPRTSDGLIILTLLAIAGLSAFSLLNLAGPFGQVLHGVLVSLFGWGGWIFPTYLFVVAALKLQRSERLRPTVVGLTIVSLAILGLLDAPLSLDPIIRAPLGGDG